MNKAYNCAVSLLAAREHGFLELVGKLTNKGFDESDILSAVEKLKKLDLQSDQRFVDMICRARIRQGYGPERIRNELKQKSVDSDLIEEKLETERSNWVSYAVEVWQKKYKQQIEYSHSEVQKQKRFLLYRGFSMDTIAMVFECLTE
ncbi:MAG: recombination regulator RecX [Legionellaceae bacterium]|nr:recombination regulator RecX [Legionellaceae bacterium]